MTAFSELPAPPQEKSGESEATREQERTSVFRWLRDRGYLIYMAAALLVATPFKHERRSAAEIPPGASWMEGIETLRNGVLYDNVETLGTFYIDNQTHRGKWIFGKEGGLKDVKYTPIDIVDFVEHELSAGPAQSITVCELHTHPLSAGQSVGFISEAESRNIREGKHSVSFPPSGNIWEGDIRFWNAENWTIALGKLTRQGINAEARSGVVDAAGITYHRLIEDQDLRQEFPEYFSELGCVCKFSFPQYIVEYEPR